MGLVAGLAKDRDDLMAQARAWCLANPKSQQPWDMPKFRWPGGDSRTPAALQMFSIAPSIASAKSFGNYPAVQHILSCVFEGGLMDFDNACVVESRYFAACAMSRESKNMIGTLWFQLNAIKKGASRPAGVPAAKVKKLGILGAGMMGAGIAYVSAKAGIDVVLLDTSEEAAAKGKAYSAGLLDKAVKTRPQHAGETRGAAGEESRPAGVPAAKVKKLGILGAGMMGAGIAYVSVTSGSWHSQCITFPRNVPPDSRTGRHSFGGSCCRL